MSESVRRRRYRYDRVMIESARILDPQLDDGVLFFTGAQIELMRNVTQYLRRLETYTSEYHLGYYLTPTAEDYDDLLAIVSDLEETLMGNDNTIWGYKEQYAPKKSDESSAPGNITLTWDPVPAGEVYILHRARVVDKDSVPSRILVVLELGTTSTVLLDVASPPADEGTVWEGLLVLAEGDYLWARFYDVTNDDRCRFEGAGYVMDVP